MKPDPVALTLKQASNVSPSLSCLLIITHHHQCLGWSPCTPCDHDWWSNACSAAMLPPIDVDLRRSLVL